MKMTDAFAGLGGLAYYEALAKGFAQALSSEYTISEGAPAQIHWRCGTSTEGKPTTAPWLPWARGRGGHQGPHQQGREIWLAAGSGSSRRPVTQGPFESGAIGQ